MYLTIHLLPFLAPSSSALSTTSITFPRDTNSTTPFCSQKSPGIYEPANGAILSQYITNYGCNNITILYCSGQYYKTSSIDTSVWLSSADSGTGSGVLLAKDIPPDNEDAAAGFYSYRYNVTLCPEDGEYRTGPFVVSVYETATGYYDAMNYELHSVNVSLATSGATA